MTFKYENTYIKDVDVIVGKNEKEGPLGSYFKKSFDDFYFGCKTWEQSESKMAFETISALTKRNKVDLLIGGDLLNQISATSFAARNFNLPFLGIYSACATSTEGVILASSLIEEKRVNNVIVNVSSNNNAAEKQFRYPVEYGGPKPKTMTFTVTGSAGIVISSEKTRLKVESGTIGEVVDYKVKDAYSMGAAMAPACAKTIYNHLKDTNRTIDYYDLVLSGDLGIYGKKILKDFMKKEYKINLTNYNDTGVMIYNTKKQSVYSGGSGPACAPIVTYTYIFDEMKKKHLKKVLLVATGALLSTATVNQKETIPAIAHAISLEAI